MRSSGTAHTGDRMRPELAGVATSRTKEIAGTASKATGVPTQIAIGITSPDGSVQQTYTLVVTR